MAYFSIAMPWHNGEERMHTLLHVPPQDNPTTTGLSPFAASLLQHSPLLALGCLDAQDRPWTTLWGGESGFSRALNRTAVGVRTMVDRRFDPVVEALVGGEGRGEGEIVKERGRGRMVGGLAIDLEMRRRVKLFGRMVAGAVGSMGGEEDEGVVEAEAEEQDGKGEVQLVVNIEQSLGNCPKYLNKKTIIPALPNPNLLSSSPQLSPEALALLAKADLFFITTSNAHTDMDTNHRGGPPGFIRLLSNKPSGAVLVYPEYSGNRLYQSLGNMLTTPKAGLVIPDFDTGDVLYITCTTDILVGEQASHVITHSNLAVRLTVTSSRFVQTGLPFRGLPGEFSPYNPKPRLLVTEAPLSLSLPQSLSTTSPTTSNTATLLHSTTLTPSIHRHTFHLSHPIRYTPGQWIALDFSPHLDIGYSHMRDDDPLSINDDFIRTFTISSSPPASSPGAGGGETSEVELTLRVHGPVTKFLAAHAHAHAQKRKGGGEVSVAVRGVGGEFSITPPLGGEEVVPFIAGGVGITPLLAHGEAGFAERVRLVWALRVGDWGFLVDAWGRYPGLFHGARVYISGELRVDGVGDDDEERDRVVKELAEVGARIEWRRLTVDDLDDLLDRVTEKGGNAEMAGGGKVPRKWYLCSGTKLRSYLMPWFGERRDIEVISESFDY